MKRFITLIAACLVAGAIYAQTAPSGFEIAASAAINKCLPSESDPYFCLGPQVDFRGYLPLGKGYVALMAGAGAGTGFNLNYMDTPTSNLGIDLGLDVGWEKFRIMPYYRAEWLFMPMKTRFTMAAMVECKYNLSKTFSISAGLGPKLKTERDTIKLLSHMTAYMGILIRPRKPINS